MLQSSWNAAAAAMCYSLLSTFSLLCQVGGFQDRSAAVRFSVLPAAFPKAAVIRVGG